MQHSLRYYRHSGLVIYKSKLPAPSVSMPCDCYILQSPTKGQVLLVLLEIVGRSHLVVVLRRCAWGGLFMGNGIKCIFAYIKEKKYGCNHDKEYGV